MSTVTAATSGSLGDNMEFWAKARRVFGELLVDKRLAENQVIARLPRFVSEYLVSKLCKKNNCSKLVEFVRKYYPDPRDKDKYLHELMVKGKLKIIDEVKVVVDVKKGLLKAVIPSLGIVDAGILEEIVSENENLMRTGMWGIVELSYMKNNQQKIIVTGFTPFQVSRIDLDWFLEASRKFSLEEWTYLIINTIGLNPEAYSPEARLILLTRLTPLVESNLNIAEFGPRATGKTFIYRNLSYYTRIISGGRVSPAQLFYNIVTKQVGLIAVKDVVVFDEVNRISFVNEDEVVGKLKDYMESGFFERGPKQAHSDCSLVFIGNVDDDVEIDTVESLLRILPKFMRDPALLDRVHGIIPGWRLPKITTSNLHLSREYGLVADFFAETLHQLRRIDYRRIVLDHVELGEGFTIRDEKAVVKLASGLIKILAPHGEVDRQLFEKIISLSVDLRLQVKQLLHTMLPREYPSPRLEYHVRWG